MKMKKIYTLVLMGWSILCFNTWSKGSNLGFDQDGYFHFNFTEPVLEMLNERLSDLPAKVAPFSFNQGQFEALVNQINELGWCELTDLEKQQIVDLLIDANDKPTKQSKDFLLKVLDTLREINDDNLITFSPTDRDQKVYDYINLLFDVLNK